MSCEKCKSENVEWVVVDKSSHLITVQKCKDCGYERLPTAKERIEFNG